ncbi:hypothetical protein K457DRAFT_372465 [Linnemannia elongata AG-77]|uniref:REJ domain-containing protein n=1 Tax=Linnemannia elongata AG-77 TaxID=1314771 RepID=A0A197KEE1_9FUNG|nr:hypothetical protein K457DRAFT_372465 [Linnemannia elongata AG-77]
MSINWVTIRLICLCLGKSEQEKVTLVSPSTPYFLTPLHSTHLDNSTLPDPSSTSSFFLLQSGHHHHHHHLYASSQQSSSQQSSSSSCSRSIKFSTVGQHYPT